MFNTHPMVIKAISKNLQIWMAFEEDTIHIPNLPLEPKQTLRQYIKTGISSHNSYQSVLRNMPVALGTESTSPA